MYLGLDLGTSGLRALLVEEHESIIGSAEAGYGVKHPHSGWSEQNPADWTVACEKAMASLRADGLYVAPVDPLQLATRDAAQNEAL